MVHVAFFRVISNQTSELNAMKRSQEASKKRKKNNDERDNNHDENNGKFFFKSRNLQNPNSNR